MALRKLSEQVEQLDNPQRSDAFVKQFRTAVRNGDFDAAYIAERFTLPKQYAKRGSDERYAKDSKDMVFEATPEFQKWFDNINQELTGSRRNTKIKASLEAFESGSLNFKQAAEETRQKMDASYKKGQSLGNSRTKSRGKAKAKSSRA